MLYNNVQSNIHYIQQNMNNKTIYGIQDSMKIVTTISMSYIFLLVLHLRTPH